MTGTTATQKPSRFIKPLLKIASPIHRFVYRTTRGRLGSRMGGMPVLLLTTVGNKSGKRRTLPLGYVPEGDVLLVIAATAGLARHPGWYHNLLVEPSVTVEFDGRTEIRRAEPLTGNDYQRWWAQITETYTAYTKYARTANRQIPIVALHPTDFSST